ncbi:MAG: amidohydrolase family protein [Acidobacteria bacterium]|nr:amidohydrolase family protein [Acidobacteriota bacterium]
MKRTLILSVLSMVFCAALGWTQQTSVASKLGYPQTIIYNGKIVTMDDESFASQVGTIMQAMAIRDGKILATGSSAEMRALAGPQTKQIDLKGRTVLPSFIMTHEHPTDWAFQEPRALSHVFPNDNGLVIHRWLPSLPPNEQMAKFEPTFKEALAKAKPGQWILISFNFGPDYEWATEMIQLFRRSITKEYLDQLAPNNPVKIKNGFITSVVNQKALDELRSVHPDLVVIGDQERERGFGFVRPMEPDAMFKGKTALLADVLKAEMELWVSNGTTTYGSSTYAYHNYQAMDYLDKKGEMPARFGWDYTGPDWSINFLRYLAGSLGHGTDHLWLIGARDAPGSNCMTIPARQEWQESQGQQGGGGLDQCNFAPGGRGRETLEMIIKSGLRIGGLHSGGDKDIDYLMDVIEQTSREAGFTLEEIRAKRHAFDHSAEAPRPEQIPRIKNLGMMVSQINTILWETHRGASVTAKKYGVEYTNWVVPRKSLTDAGVMTTFEIDRPLPHKVFFFITKGMNRYNDRDQMVYGPNQKTDRIVQLKALTRWGGYYVLRENLLGTLEPGKFADFMVLDRDFLTIPEADIPKIKVLMTVVGGKTVHLGADLSREIGMPPVGPTTWTEPIPAGWEPKPY